MADNEVYDRDVLKRIDYAYKEESMFVARTRLAEKFIVGQRILDVGCGTGNTSLRIAHSNLDTDILAIDLNRTCIEFTGEKVRSIVNISIAQMEVCNLALKDETFDCLVAIDVLEHVECDEKAMMEMFRVIIPTGRLVVTVPAIKVLYGKRDRALKHFRRYSKQELQEKLRNAGFRTEKIVYWNPLAILPFLLSEKILGRPLACPAKWSIKKTRWGRIGRSISSLMTRLVCLEAPIGLSLLVVAMKDAILKDFS